MGRRSSCAMGRSFVPGRPICVISSCFLAQALAAVRGTYLLTTTVQVGPPERWLRQLLSHSLFPQI